MDIYDFMGDSAPAVLAEVLGGMYEDLTGNIEITEDGAHLIIKGGDEGSWILTLRKVPVIEISKTKEVEMS